MGTNAGYELGCASRTVVTVLEVSEKEEGVMALHLPKGLVVTLLEVSERKGCSGHTPIYWVFKGLVVTLLEVSEREKRV